MTYFASVRDRIENGYDPDATIRDAIQEGVITHENIEDQARVLLANYIEVNAEGGLTTENADLTVEDFCSYILDVFEEYDR